VPQVSSWADNCKHEHRASTLYLLVSGACVLARLAGLAGWLAGWLADRHSWARLQQQPFDGVHTSCLWHLSLHLAT
jgi:hypothetical protein